MTPNETALARARYVRTLLAWHDLTQSDLARILGIGQPSAGRKLKAQRRFEVDELVAIADTFGIDVAKLVHPPALDGDFGTPKEPMEPVGGGGADPFGSQPRPGFTTMSVWLTPQVRGYESHACHSKLRARRSPRVRPPFSPRSVPFVARRVCRTHRASA